MKNERKVSSKFNEARWSTEWSWKRKKITISLKRDWATADALKNAVGAATIQSKPNPKPLWSIREHQRTCFFLIFLESMFRRGNNLAQVVSGTLRSIKGKTFNATFDIWILSDYFKTQQQVTWSWLKKKCRITIPAGVWNGQTKK